MNDILKYDPSFAESTFLTNVDNMFVQVQLAITTKNVDRVKHFISNNLYEGIKSRVANLGTNIEFFDEINVKDSKIVETKVDGDVMLIKVRLTSRYINYITDANNKLISGDNRNRIVKENDLLLVKNTNFVKNTSEQHKCHSCGSNVDVNNSGVCPYCGNIYDLKNENWTILGIQTY